MDKYTKILIMLLKIPIGVLCILVGLALIGVSVWVSTFSDVASMILIMSLIGGGALINYGVGYAFLGDEYKSTHFVREGSTKFAPVETLKFLKRRKLVTFIGAISYLVLAVYYVVRIILVSIYTDYLTKIDYNTSIVALIIFTLIALFVAFFLFLLYKRTKHIDLNEI